MKRITALALAASCALPAFTSLHAATLETRSYTVEITPLCGERVVDCEQFAYAGTHNRNGSRINMTGKPGLRQCGPRDCCGQTARVRREAVVRLGHEDPIQPGRVPYSKDRR